VIAAVSPRERLFARNLPVQPTLDCDEVLSFGLGALLVAAQQLADIFRGERGHDPSTRTSHDPGRNRHTYESNATTRSLHVDELADRLSLLSPLDRTGASGHASCTRSTDTFSGRIACGFTSTKFCQGKLVLRLQQIR
jgi:hypothetical protein